MSFISQFHSYVKSRTDAPPEFHVHAAMAALGYVMGSNVWSDAWSRPVYPNLWIAIIARSGMGKSVPLDMSQSLVEMAGYGDGILPTSFSQEALVAHLENHPTGVFYLQELSAFLGLIRRDYNCVDSDTEVLTRTGWKTHDSLVIGEDILTCVTKGPSSFLEWKPVTNIYRYGLVSEDLLNFTGRTVSMTVTNNHKVVLGDGRKVYADDIPAKSRILQVARWSGGYGRECANKHLAALIGWYVSEGWNDHNSIRIAQKSYITQLVTALNGYKTKGRHGNTTIDITEQSERRDMRWFCIKGKTAENIKYWAPDKQLRWDILWRWPKTSLKALFDALMQGDGCLRHENDQRTRSHQGEGTFTQLDKDRGDFFQALCLRLGYRSTRWTHPILGWSHYSVSNAKTAPVPKPTVSKYTGIVWCPQNENSTWVARHAGRVFITGNSGSEAWLTEIFDVPEINRRITMKKDNPVVTLRKPCLTILGASSPDWFAESFKTSSLRGGFLARFMFCPSNDPGEYIGFPGPRDSATEAMLAGHLRAVADMTGRFDFSKVMKQLNDWDRQSREHLRKDCPPEFSGMRSRAGVMVLKASMIFHASADPDSLMITIHDLEQAIRYVEKTHTLAEKYLSEEVAADRYEVHRLKIIEVVRSSNGHIPWSRALRNTHLSGRDFRAAVETLCESERLHIESGAGKTKYLRLPTLPTIYPHSLNGNGNGIF